MHGNRRRIVRHASSLNRYQSKRNFQRSPEPKPGSKTKPKTKTRRSGRHHARLAFVVQKHRASHLHYDFRLELDGVLKSWAVPKGPSLDPKQKRLAMRVEDHPLAYRTFEGRIPEGNYGAGEVIVWDRGTYRCAEASGEEAVRRQLRKGALKIVLRGHKLKGGFALVRLATPRRWLLIKSSDQYATLRDVTRDDRSVRTHRRLADAAPSGARRKAHRR
ncbi:DNA polymerase ligase N-terminal domain-containing protein [Bradyrhizobium sp.]|uniref:DNA polymerase ligase N-terminal domain-containing protein n=1 Tax=Bradyrhizobium sp. TaxID=376 RepID=UPI001D3D16C4|nr:DNA polymerase ligase N-terminal domain-containing protein [Bradyrhizobium sp.]MBI5319483.1 3'-phosphoesterase [Bradyrhizobium sp.]